MEIYPSNWTTNISPLVIVQGAGSKDIQKGAFGGATLPLFRNQKDVSTRNQSLISDLFKFWGKFSIDKGTVFDEKSSNHYKFQQVSNSYEIPIVTEEGEETIPNEIINLDWVDLYNEYLPCLFVSFYQLDDSLTDFSEIEATDAELIYEISTIKQQLQSNNIKYLAVIITSSQDTERLNNYRKQTLLNSRNGLFFLRPDSSPKELNAFALDLLSIIKPNSIEFYTNIEKKFRKTCQKLLQSNSQLIASPNTESMALDLKIQINLNLKISFAQLFISNYETSLKSFELVYDQLSQLLKITRLSNDNHNVYHSIRLLLDLVIFQIFRICLYLQSPNAGYRKFTFHLNSISGYLKTQKIEVKIDCDVKWWLSKQYKWIAQLVDLCPASIVPNDVAYVKDSKDPLNPLVLRHSGFLYLQSASFLKGIEDKNEETDIKEQYSTLPKELNIQNELINLLTFSKLSFQKKDNSFNRTVTYINFQLADLYFNLKQYEKAFKLFEIVLDTLKTDQYWSFLESHTYYKLFLCSIELKKYHATVLNLLELSSTKKLDTKVQSNIINIVKGDDFKSALQSNHERILINTTTDDSFDGWFKSQILFKKEKVSMNDEIQLQVIIESNINQSILGIFEFDYISIKFDSLEPLVLENDSDSNDTGDILEIKPNEESSTYRTNLKFNSTPSNPQRIFHISLPTTKIGKATIISIIGFLKTELFDVQLNIPIVEDSFKIHHVWFDPTSNHKGLKSSVIKSKNNRMVETIPRVPDIAVSWDENSIPTSVLIIGEVLKIGVKIKDTDYERVKFELKCEALLDEKIAEIDWVQQEGINNGKLELVDLEKDQDFISYFKLKTPEKIGSLALRVSIVLFLGNDKETPIKVPSLTKSFKVINPFDINLSIHPRLENSDFSSLFHLEESETKVIPRPSRYWLMKAMISLKDEVLTLEDLKLLKDEIKIFNNPNSSNTTCVEDLTSYKRNNKDEEGVIQTNHYFYTKIEDGHTYRNIQFEAQLSLNWRRVESDIQNKYLNHPWKLSLPFLDPRVLLEVEYKSDQDIQLKYYIENPSSKIFTFNVNLLENHNFQISGGLKKLPNLDILPLNRQILIFQAILSTGRNESPVLLPVLKVYDVNYRVNLPTLAISDNVVSWKNDLFLVV